MKTDRELLELAAKAAGIGWNADSGYRTTGYGATGVPLVEQWNPLTDDGDALRLAVKLQIDIKQYGEHVVAWFDGGYTGTGRISYDNDPCAATRRAIVRAAAAIGETE